MPIRQREYHKRVEVSDLDARPKQRKSFHAQFCPIFPRLLMIRMRAIRRSRWRVPRLCLGSEQPAPPPRSNEGCLQTRCAGLRGRGAASSDDLIKLLSDLPQGVSQISNASRLAAGIADQLLAAVATNPLIQSQGPTLDPGMLYEGGNRTRVSIINSSDWRVTRHGNPLSISCICRYSRGSNVIQVRPGGFTSSTRRRILLPLRRQRLAKKARSPRRPGTEIRARHDFCDAGAEGDRQQDLSNLAAHFTAA